MTVIYKLNSFSNLIVGIIIFIGFAFTTFQVHKGSKSAFAYTLMMFTFGYAI